MPNEQSRDALTGLIERLPQKARALRDTLSDAAAKAGYVWEATQVFAQANSLVLNMGSSFEDEREAIGGAVVVGMVLEAELDGLATAAGGISAGLDLAVPLFSSASSTSVATCNSLTVGGVVTRHTPCPFLPDSDQDNYARKLDQLEPSLGATYRSAWHSLYSEPHDSPRGALWEMRHTFDHLFERIAPDELVRNSPHWSRKLTGNPEAVHRAERLRFAASRWVTNERNRVVLTESADETGRVYNRLNQAHARGELDKSRAEEVFRSVDAVLRRWIDAIEPWPPKTA